MSVFEERVNRVDNDSRRAVGNLNEALDLSQVVSSEQLADKERIVMSHD